MNIQGSTKNREQVKRILRKEEVELTRLKVLMQGIDCIGYDALFGILEVQMANGAIWWYYDVPDAVWYQWRQSLDGISYFHKYISGEFLGEQMS